MFFYKGLSVFFATRAHLFTIGKTTIGKIKTKKRDYVQIQKVKTKNITNESLPVPYVIDQCSRGDRTCG